VQQLKVVIFVLLQLLADYLYSGRTVVRQTFDTRFGQSNQPLAITKRLNFNVVGCCETVKKLRPLSQHKNPALLRNNLLKFPNRKEIFAQTSTYLCSNEVGVGWWKRKWL